ncbi:MAG: indole-3-glycerol phosphate synthase TrpC [Helicobacteraceae bacterium]|jgi:indole-3-glycerol phosphate synthase|nr:indole-3-glycerol phosphate synthase TrpC [Helicobacteraceae bacterium]
MILDEIVRHSKETLKERQKNMPEEMLGRAMAMNPFYPLDAIAALRAEEGKPRKIIAEVKRASPSRGEICPASEFDPIAIASDYARGGAAAISVLTEPKWFGGDLEYLTLIRRYSSVPLLRKDFITDRYQLLEALFYGASFVLLIARILSRKELSSLLEQARGLGMEALVEIHDKGDLTKAIVAGAAIIGINHRNLDTLEMDMSLGERLIPLIPNGKVIVAESGLDSKEQIERLANAGFDAFLIGESLMKSRDRVAAVRALAER